MSQQKTALITGGNKGIGFEICRQLALKGFKVFLTARNNERGKDAVKKLADENLEVNFIPLDVTDYENIQNAVKLFKESSSQLDVLINNAGILLDEKGITGMEKETLPDTLKTNVTGPLWVIQSFYPLMKKGSRIINISSGAGQLSSMATYAPAYSISKAALNAITLQAASAFSGKGIAVNSVCPGWVKSDMGGRGAPRSPEKGAETPVWLATEAPVDLTGKFLRDKKVIDW